MKLSAVAAAGAAALAAALVALLLGGCGLGAGSAPRGVSLTITQGFGARLVRLSAAPSTAGRETVLQLLMRQDRVGTRHGRFVQSIDGLAAGTRAGHPFGWFYYVNGILAPKGAAGTDLFGGDHVWWDLHDSSASPAAGIPAVVGSFPEPFLHGSGGNRYPVTVFCAVPAGDACRTVTARLVALGVPAALGALGTDEPQTLRILVGPWLEIRSDPAAAELSGGPSITGVYARFSTDGNRLSLLDADGATVRSLAAGAGLVAADVLPNEVPTWFVTGTDSPGADAAAHALDASTLRDRFALALAGGHALGVPLTGGGPVSG